MRTVVITGTSRGLGRALLDAFIANGDRVIGIARDKGAVEELINELDANSFIGYTANVTDAPGISRIMEDVVERTGHLDILINNAAIYPKVSFLEESADEFLYGVNVDLGGVANCCKAALKHMIRQERGRIYNVGSWADLGPISNSAVYSTSKGGLHALTKSIAQDIAHLNLDVEIHEWIPGHLNTRMSDFTGIDPRTSAQWAVEISTTTASTKNCIFEMNREWSPPKSLRHRLQDALFFWR